MIIKDTKSSMEIDGGNMNIPVLEVASQPPYSLNITLLHPETQRLLCISVHVQLGGQIKAIVHNNNNVPGNTMVCSNEYITLLLNKCHSIPMAMTCLLNRKA